jgi:transcriptional regulator with XRE-family HTH domain
MLTKEEIKERLSDRSATVVAKRLGLNFATVNRVKSGEGNPTYKTISKLSDYLEKHP